MKHSVSKQLLSAILAFVMVIGLIPATTLTAFAASKTQTTESAATDEQENDELFAYFAEEKLYGYERATFGTRARDGLNDVEQAIYDALKANIEAVAANGGSTVFALSEVSGLQTTWTNTDLGVDSITDSAMVEEKFEAQFNFNSIVTALLNDCPFDLYWYDKTIGAQEIYYMGFSGYSDGKQDIWNVATITDLTFTFTVASGYQDGNDTTVTSDVTQVTYAKEKAAAIVEKYEGKSDYEKLLGYKEEICVMTAYNYTAAKEYYTSGYGNPWQLIHVFDDDDTTTVVCEGYAKAFQYLCDLGGLDCICVTGEMSSGIGAGAHMWNVVTLNGKNYLVDVTNCDVDNMPASDEPFLLGGAYANGGYNYIIGNQVITYTCNDLSLAASAYTPGEDEATTYTVFFNSNGGGGTMTDVTDISGDYILPANGFTAPSNKQFKAWAIDSIDGMQKQPGDRITITGETDIYAIWEAVEYNVTLNGTVTSFNDASGDLTLQLFKQGMSEPTYETVVKSNTLQYSIEGVAAGTYTLKVSKKNHVTRTYTVVVGSDGNVTQDVKVCLIGDVNGDDKISAVDKKLIYDHIESSKELTGYAFDVADVSNDSKISAVDKKMVYSHISGDSSLWT